MLGSDYDLLIHSIPLDDIQRVLNLDIADHDKRRLIAYHIALKLEGITLRVPVKTHKVDLANFLIDLGIDKELVIQSTEIARRTYYNLKGKQ